MAGGNSPSKSKWETTNIEMEKTPFQWLELGRGGGGSGWMSPHFGAYQRQAWEAARRQSAPLRRGGRDASKYQMGGSRYVGRGGGSYGGGTGMGGGGMSDMSHITAPEKIEVEDNPYEKIMAGKAASREDLYKAERDQSVALASKMAGEDPTADMIALQELNIKKRLGEFNAKLGSLGMSELGLSTDVVDDWVTRSNEAKIAARVAGQSERRSNIAALSNVVGNASAGEIDQLGVVLDMYETASGMFERTRALENRSEGVDYTRQLAYESMTGQSIENTSPFVGGKASQRRA